MTSKIINSAKYLLVFGITLFGVIACERDFEDIGVNLVDNNLFETKDTTFNVIAYTQNIERSEVIGDNPNTGFIDGLPIFNIGILKDANFGTLKASFISQIQLPGAGIDFGLNPVIDTVILDIPYFATRIENNENGTPNFELDSIFGDVDSEFQIKVSRSGTFLNLLDPSDPTQNKKYYSDESYTRLSELHSSSFKPNNNDTVLYVNRNQFEGAASIDTLKNDDLSPTIKLSLDKGEIKRILIDEITSASQESLDAFADYFRGLIIEPVGEMGSIMQLALNDATMNIYYTNEVLTDEAGTDLNDDGDTTDLQVPVKRKQLYVFSLGGIRTANYVRDYSQVPTLVDLYTNPNTVEGEEKLFLSGAAGTHIDVDLFENVDLGEIRDKNWLINGAFLELYIDDLSDIDLLPNRLYIYKKENNVVVDDVITEAPLSGADGFLIRDDEDNPEKYRFQITDYVSEILKQNDFSELSKLAIRIFHTTDAPLSPTDTIIRDFSWNPKNVILKGNNLPLTDTERLELKIFYTKDPQ